MSIPRQRRAEDNSVKIKEAVKEALDDKWRVDTTKQITDLATQMTAGFSAVNARHDTANGKLIKHDQEIATIKGTSVYTNVLWFLVTTLVGVVVFLSTHH